MPGESEQRRLLLLADEPARGQIEPLLRSGPGWEVAATGTVEQARFLLQMDAWDALVIDDPRDPADVVRLTERGDTRVLLLSDDPTAEVVGLLQQGTTQWLPRRVALGSPALLQAAVIQAGRLTERERQLKRTREQLATCREQVQGLVEMLWTATPVAGRPCWFSPRGMMERLHEEAARAQRHGSRFSVAVGEVAGEPVPDRPVLAWAAERIGQVRRASDAAGQYGPHGFLLLLPNTDPDGARVCCRRLRQRLEQEAPGRVRVTFGIGSWSPPRTSVPCLLRQAEEDLDRTRGEPTSAL
jgi:PleD family two-component response regulator